ncbi:uncharacterized protein LOC124948283 [Vespa velutina]|uniref:uncharacterized protein LOC124948283 n=1 Tax=Vespa velutina TaxID=202808 RepID=UPI001FB2BC97|nr:uncharacterized protein LOC124948283 [Vespa velutina]
MFCLPTRKIHRHNKIKANHIDVLDNRFDHVHLDIIFLPNVKDYQYCLTIIDRFTRWPVAILLKDMTTDIITTALYEHWICHYGTPIKITIGQGTQFKIVERMHRILKATLMCSPKSWMEILSTVLLGLRKSFKLDIQATPADILYGICLYLPDEFFVTAEQQSEP